MKIAVLSLLIISSRILFFFIIKGTHSPLFYLNANNLKDLSQYLLFGLLLLELKQCVHVKFHLVLNTVCAYCLVFSVLMIYGLLPHFIAQGFNQAWYVLNGAWIIILIGLIVYLFINRKVA